MLLIVKIHRNLEPNLAIVKTHQEEQQHHLVNPQKYQENKHAIAAQWEGLHYLDIRSQV